MGETATAQSQGHVEGSNCPYCAVVDGPVTGQQSDLFHQLVCQTFCCQCKLQGGLHDQLQGWMKKQKQLRGNMAITSPATHSLHHGALLETMSRYPRLPPAILAAVA